VSECDREASIMRRPRPPKGLSSHEKKNNSRALVGLTQTYDRMHGTYNINFINTGVPLRKRSVILITFTDFIKFYQMLITNLFV
jgi:hypothetical protein